MILWAVGSTLAREWTDSRGRTISGKYLSYEDGKVAILSNGKKVVVPLKNLSTQDQRYVLARSQGKPAPPDNPPPNNARPDNTNPFEENPPSTNSSSVSNPADPFSDAANRSSEDSSTQSSSSDPPPRGKPLPGTRRPSGTTKTRAWTTKTRAWTTSRGVIRARFVNIVNGQIVLQRGSRRIERLPFGAVSDQDRQYIGEVLAARGDSDLFEAVQNQFKAASQNANRAPSRGAGNSGPVNIGPTGPPDMQGLMERMGIPLGRAGRARQLGRMPRAMPGATPGSMRGRGGVPFDSSRSPFSTPGSPFGPRGQSQRGMPPSMGPRMGPRMGIEGVMPGDPSSGDPFAQMPNMNPDMGNNMPGAQPPRRPSPSSLIPESVRKPPDPPQFKPPSSVRPSTVREDPFERLAKAQAQPAPRNGVTNRARPTNPSSPKKAHPVSQKVAVGFALAMLGGVLCSILLFFLFIAFIIWLIVRLSSKPRYSHTY